MLYKYYIRLYKYIDKWVLIMFIHKTYAFIVPYITILLFNLCPLPKNIRHRIRHFINKLLVIQI